ncbi:hypothetical protein KC345_g7629 [Hortaea werneckii]|nr:hypothetical protein KC345_g7629 [Hortaea werneckii]
MTRNTVLRIASEDPDHSGLIQTVPILDVDTSQLITTIREDVKDITSSYECSYSRTRLRRLRAYHGARRTELTSVCYSHLDQEGQVDHIPLKKYLDRQLEGLDTTQDGQFIAEKEHSWCEAEIVKASNDLGYGQDWQAALEHVKNMYVRPGQQTHLVRRSRMLEDGHDEPERQKENPFFLGGERIIVSTVFHELVPGHHLQYHMIKRYRSYRSLFSTPFWMEGWAFYWEFILWDRGFASTPEDKIGMLFWRMHRCARIVFSLKFHLGEMTPQECVEYLVAKVGHERATAEGEVRRSFSGDYSPLYQAGYMLGALQFYALRKEKVDAGGMPEKQFHDRILKEGEMPIELLRSLLHESPLKPEHRASWRFYDL